MSPVQRPAAAQNVLQQPAAKAGGAQQQGQGKTGLQQQNSGQGKTGLQQQQETHDHVEKHNAHDTKQLLAHKVILPNTTHFKINGGDPLAGPRLAEAPDYDYSTVVHHTGADRSTERTTAQPNILYSQTKDANNVGHTNEAGDGETDGGRRRKR